MSEREVKKPKLMSQEQEQHQTNLKDQKGFTNIDAQVDAVDDQPVREVESLCMNCHEQGTTRLLLTRIPYFREIILMSFECPHCHFKNSEIQPAAQIAEKGARYVLKCENKDDLLRQIVKSETATVRFTELDIEIPPKRGQLINAEGILAEMIEDLEGDQEERRKVQPEMAEKIDEVIANINAYRNGEKFPLTVSVDDPAGNSWIEYTPGEPQHKWAMYEYARTAEQNVFLGLISADEVAQHRLREQEQKKAATDSNVSLLLTTNNEADEKSNPRTTAFLSDETGIDNFENEVQTFSAHCSLCGKPCETHMKPVNIPHFADVILMLTVCDHCGYKLNEVKTGGAIPDKGKKITLKITDPTDLARDILKLETCGMTVPELLMDLTPGTLGGRFTTIEGLLTQVREELHSRVFTQTLDLMDADTKQNWTLFFAKLDDAIAGRVGFTINMVDPLGALYIQNVYAPDNDPNMTIEEFERTHEQNEDLGLNDMKTD